MKTKFKEITASKRSVSRRRLVCGIGVNDSDYITSFKIEGRWITCPYYTKWVSMLTRCYSQKFHARRPTYIGCSVIPEWLIFSNFRAWMIKQNWREMHLDKDVLVPGNKTYSPDVCAFISRDLNNLLGDNAAIRGKYPQGVCWSKDHKSFEAQIKRFGKRRYIGRYKTVEHAESAYKTEKAKHIREVVRKETGDSKIIAAIDLRASKLEEKLPS